jgi:hypothetical protein
LNRKLATLTAVLLIALIALSLFLTFNLFANHPSSRQFYVGVEYAYGNNQTAQVQVSQIEALANKVKDYTNLFVIGSVGLTFNETALYEACDYIYNNTNLNFIVLFTGSNMYSYMITQWIVNANSLYGDRFLGIYKYDEPGGNQIDNTPSQLINKTVISPDASYSDISTNYVGNITYMVQYFQNNSFVNVSTADYGLYWFDYKSDYNTIYAEFVGNESRQRIIALDRGAAEAFGEDWGVIVTWKYSQYPYLENATELYNDLSLAYSAGAKYAIVFSYSSPNITAYGTLTDDHFDALQHFWNTLHSNPDSFGSNKPEVAYIVPKDYGFGFRSPNDTIWGLKPADELSAKVFYDINNTLIAKYGSHFDILYDEPEIIAPLLKNYAFVYYWNQTIP